MKVYYDKDSNFDVIKEKKITTKIGACKIKPFKTIIKKLP